MRVCVCEAIMISKFKCLKFVSWIALSMGLKTRQLHLLQGVNFPTKKLGIPITTGMIQNCI